jgi:hypothetical protein
VSASVMNVRRASLLPAAAPDEESVPSPPAPAGGVDAPLLAITLLLTVFGVVMVYSASAVFAARMHHNAQFFLVRQGLYAVVGAAAMAFIASLDHKRLRALSYPALIGTFGLMLAVPFLGHRVNGAVRWIRLGPINLQPAEIAKVALIVWLAHSLAKKNEKIRTFSVGFLPHLMMAGLAHAPVPPAARHGLAGGAAARAHLHAALRGRRAHGYILLAGLFARARGRVARHRHGLPPAALARLHRPLRARVPPRDLVPARRVADRPSARAA